MHHIFELYLFSDVHHELILRSIANAVLVAVFPHFVHLEIEVAQVVIRGPFGKAIEAVLERAYRRLIFEIRGAVAATTMEMAVKLLHDFTVSILTAKD